MRSSRSALFLPQRHRLLGLCSVLLGLVGLGLLVSPAHPIASTYTNPLLLEFLAGALIGYLYQRNRLIAGRAALGVFAAGIALLLASSSLYSDPEGLPAAMMFVGALGIPGFERLNPGLLTVGNASYSIYLAHMLPLTILQIIFARLPGLDGSFPGLLVFLGLGVPASVVVGCLAYRTIEGPVELRLRAPDSRAIAAGQSGCAITKGPPLSPPLFRLSNFLYFSVTYEISHDFFAFGVAGFGCGA